MSWVARLFDKAPSTEERLAEALVAWKAAEYGVALDLWAPLAQAGVAHAASTHCTGCCAPKRAAEPLS